MTLYVKIAGCKNWDDRHTLKLVKVESNQDTWKGMIAKAKRQST